MLLITGGPIYPTALSLITGQTIYLAERYANLDPAAEQALAEEGLAEDMAQWQTY